MSKVKIKSHLHNKTLNEVYTNDVIGIKNHDKILYKEESVNVVICVKEIELFIERKHQDYNLTLHLSNENITKGNYNINGIGKITLHIETKSLFLEKNEIKTKYIIDFGGNEITEFEFSLKMEELK